MTMTRKGEPHDPGTLALFLVLGGSAADAQAFYDQHGHDPVPPTFVELQELISRFIDEREAERRRRPMP